MLIYKVKLALPKDQTRLQIWLNIVGLQNTPTNQTSYCHWELFEVDHKANPYKSLILRAKIPIHVRLKKIRNHTTVYEHISCNSREFSVLHNSCLILFRPFNTQVHYITLREKTNSFAGLWKQSLIFTRR